MRAEATERRSDGATEGAERIARELQGLIEGEVRFGRHDRMLYATDASIYQVEPLGVVIPRSVADVEAVVRYCAAARLPIVPRGGGTSLAGQAVGPGIVIDCSRHLTAVRRIDGGARVAEVEPGLVLDDLNAALAPHGLTFGPDVATSGHACLGGMIGNNSAGARSVLYGRTVEHLLGLDVLLADGEGLRLDRAASTREGRVRDLLERVAAIVLPLAEEIERRYPKIVRHVDGYNLDLFLEQARRSAPGTYDQVNLAHLFCGSEGTLGVTVGATLALVERPRAAGLAIVAFSSVDEALAAVPGVLATGPSAVELIDEVVMGAARAHGEFAACLDVLPRPGDRSPAAVLYVEHFAESEPALRARLEQVERSFGRERVVRCDSPDSRSTAWKLRKAGEPLLHGMPGRRKPVTFIEDLAVDPRVLPAFVRDFRAIITAHGTRAAYYAHASVGCLHIRPLIDMHDPADVEVMQSIALAATDLVIRYGGALSGEHGDGRLRSHLLERFYGPAICEAFSAVKAVFDPQGRLNPGVICNPQPMVHRLRVLPDTRPAAVPQVDTFFRYEREHGFGEAVTLCNGAGVCRRLRGGTMCPSYRATRDERHSTRGRGNALRLAITGQLSLGGTGGAGGTGGGPDWLDEETHRTLDLCLSCKACRSECPSGVDVARLKAEFLAQAYRAAGRPPLRARVFGRVRSINRLGSALWPLANVMAGLGPVRAAAAHILGIDRRRSLPHFRPSLARWFQKRGRRGAAGSAVILLPDCFTLYNEPHVGRAAVELLESLGYRVVLPDTGCCGRALISNGLLEEAVRTCAATARALHAAVEEHAAVAIVGCEPSCVSAITDDWTDLRLEVDRARVDALARLCVPIEAFAEQHFQSRTAEPPGPPEEDGPAVLVHGHCHQKALWGVSGLAAVMRRAVGRRLTVLDSGCCGMAGSFGYTADHYDLSMAIGELSLFPPIRADGSAIVVAPGTSCRHQIADATGRAALHPVQVIARWAALSRSPASRRRE